MADILIPERLFQAPMVDQRGFLSRVWMDLLRKTVVSSSVGADALDESAMWQGFATDEPDAPEGSARPEPEPDAPMLPRAELEPDVFPVPCVPRAVLPDSGLLAAIPSGLGPADAGREYRATDYRHRYIWTGTAWQLAEGDASGYVVAGKPDGTAPNGGLFGLCDGSAYDVAQDNGTVANVTTLDMTGDVFILGGVPGRRVAVAPTWDATAATESEPAHAHVISSDGVHSHSITPGTSKAGTGADIATSPAATGVDGDHDHGGATDSSGDHVHALTDANAKILAPSEANGGLPVRVAMNWYIRR